jgi:putative glutamine amidotransferase
MNRSRKPRIAIPLPHALDAEYAERAIPQYERAVELSGGEPVRIPLQCPPGEVMRFIEDCDAVLLPGSKADVDPAKFAARPHPKTQAPDRHRDRVDELLLEDAYNKRKPILGICYGLQSLNVYRSGTLLQHIESPVNHEAGRKVAVAHTVAIDPSSKLAEVLRSVCGNGDGEGLLGENLELPACDSLSRPPSTARVMPVNSSHHQAAEAVGDGLRIVARCPDDNVIEALEGTLANHFVLAVQWHPERSFDQDERSQRIFKALIKECETRLRT